MGITLMENFRRPYASRSIGEFWTRWHISLSRWFRDYVYIPLGGNRVGEPTRLRNLIIVFLVSGLWHGASWTFVVWGALHAAYVIIEDLGGRFWPESQRAWLNKWVANVVAIAAVAFAWIFFRAGSIADALYIATHLTSGAAAQVTHPAALFSALSEVSPSRRELVIAALGIITMHYLEKADAASDLRQRLAMQPIWRRWSAYYLVLLSLALLGVYSNESFIYFQF